MFWQGSRQLQATMEPKATKGLVTVKGPGPPFVFWPSEKVLGDSSPERTLRVRRHSREPIGRPYVCILARPGSYGPTERGVWGPFCRTFSLSRYLPPGFPKPLRGRTASTQWGWDYLTSSEREQILTDGILMFRMVWLYLIAEPVATELNLPKPFFGMEHPKDPETWVPTGHMPCELLTPRCLRRPFVGLDVTAGLSL